MGAYAIAELKETPCGALERDTLWRARDSEGKQIVLVVCPVAGCNKVQWLGLEHPGADGKCHKLHLLPGGKGWIEGSLEYKARRCKLHYFIKPEGVEYCSPPPAPCEGR